MTFKKAYEIAMARSEHFRRHDAKVKECESKGIQSDCLIFAVGPGETFYYGFDGYDMHKGKHTRRRSEILFRRGHVLIIL